MGHWYDTEGKPCHTIDGRDTTLRDARKLDLFPSVTTVLNVVDKPGLNVWKQNQLYLACWDVIPELVHSGIETPEELEKAVEDSKKGIMQEARSIGEEAAALGTDIHKAFEEYVEKGSCTRDEFEPTCQKVLEYVEKHFGEIVGSEVNFINKEAGYGGQIDLIVKSPKGLEVIIDLKTKDFQPKAKAKSFVFDGHIMQLAAYVNWKPNVDLDKVRVVNLFISTNEEHFGEILHHEWTNEQMRRGGMMFTCLLQFWQIQKKYGPVWDIIKGETK